jgi:hypothetical protein
MDNETEIERLKREIERLQQALDDRQRINVAAPSLTDNSQTNLAQSCREHGELLQDLARYSEGLYTEKFIRRKYRGVLSDADWEQLGSDEGLIEKIELEKTRRIRNGQAKREKAQQHIVKGPDVLEKIMSDPKSNARHVVDAIKTLDHLADPGPQVASPADKFIITIDLSADAKLKSAEPDPNDVITIEATRPAAIADKSEDDWK